RGRTSPASLASRAGTENYAKRIRQRESVQKLNPNLAIADVLLRVIAAAVDLQADTALVRMAFFLVRELHELHALDPGGDVRRVADNAGTQFIPFAVLPEFRPLLGRDRQRRRSFDLLDLGYLIQE